MTTELTLVLCFHRGENTSITQLPDLVAENWPGKIPRADASDGSDSVRVDWFQPDDQIRWFRFDRGEIIHTARKSDERGRD